MSGTLDIIYAPKQVFFQAGPPSSAGELFWTEARDPKVNGYVVYMWPASDAFDDDGNPVIDHLDEDSNPVYKYLYSNGSPKFSEIARVSINRYVIPQTDTFSAMFSVRAVATDGRMSPHRFLSTTDAVELSNPALGRYVIDNWGDTILIGNERLLRHL
jgi:hypothetical protein